MADVLPNLGRARYVRADVDGGIVANMAAVLEMAKSAQNARSVTFLETFNAEWARIEGDEMTEGERQMQAFQMALSEMLRVHGSAPTAG